MALHLFWSMTALLLSLSFVASQTSASTVLPPSKDPFYTAPHDFAAARPGQILKIRHAPGNLSTVFNGSSDAHNILYRTTDSTKRPAWAVTTLFTPKHHAESNCSKLVSYQMAYDSADLDASPSYAMYSGYEGNESNDLPRSLAQGWYVNVPDYEGPLASYGAGVTSGYATLDSVRAVLSSGLLEPGSSRYTMWGYSGGALASEFAAELQEGYAPELHFAGTALGGLVPNDTSLFYAATGTYNAGILPAGLVGLSTQHPALLRVLEEEVPMQGPYNASTFFSVRKLDLTEEIETFYEQDIQNYFKSGLDLFHNPVVQEVQKSDTLMGVHGVPRIPVFAYKAVQDELSPIAETDALLRKYCDKGAQIQYQRNSIGGHDAEQVNGDAAAFAFLAEVLNETYKQRGCHVKQVSVNVTSSPL